MTKKWGSSGYTLSNFTGGGTAPGTYNGNYSVWWSKMVTVSGHPTVAQIQAAAANFNPNLFYFYDYNSSQNSTRVFYGYMGQSTSQPPGGLGGYENNDPAVVTTNPQNLSLVTSTQAIYFILSPGTVTGSTGSYGTAYQVTTAIGNTPLTATSTTVTQPLNLTYYASLPYGQDVAPGVYTDTVVIQVTF